MAYQLGIDGHQHPNDDLATKKEREERVDQPKGPLLALFHQAL